MNRFSREQETLSYAVIKSSGLSLTAARNHFGIENITDRCRSVERAMEESRLIHELSVLDHWHPFKKRVPWYHLAFQ